MDKINERLLYLQKSIQKRDELEQIHKENKELYERQELDLRLYEKVLHKEKRDAEKLERFTITRMVAKHNDTLEEKLVKETKEYNDANKTYKIIKNELYELQQIVSQSKVNFDEIVEEEKEPNILIKYTKEQVKWISIEDEKPGHKVVLGACDSYDCGWVMECVWWNVDKKCWMNNSDQTDLHYTHWQDLPSEPDFTMW